MLKSIARKYKIKYFFTLLLFFASIFSISNASDMTSTNFIIRDPSMGTGGEYGESANFKLYSAGNTLLSGTGSSATYIGRFGFLYYPFVSTGTLTAVANGADGDLSWAASSAAQGWTVSGYNTGIASVSGGPYTYTDVGNVTSYTYEGLTPGDYCFVVQTVDALDYVIATSNEDCITIEPTVTFSLSAATVDLGTLTTGATGTGTHTFSALSNAPSGFVVTYNGPTLTNNAAPAYTIPVYTSSASVPGTAGFGINLKNNATPNIGAEPTTNYGTCNISAGYNTADAYSFVNSSTTTIATSSAAPTSCVYTVSYVGNISSTTAAGDYSSNITYIVTATF